ncbi:Zn(II)2Cys6 cluster transcripitional activator [Purpureocillium lavendulum]|uniref:Zn(II)2Cys6 cluster transcripitional activator n=1 Tax=Purpureocillium lavendulum TaxID=1247861 RepID=A0AB34G3G6_9HYPO|nr:Zn(II)2Cys6 cluster transcripitional activator [Purpureocillium lavendulum]
MPRTSFSRNPLLRVSRPVSACSRCRLAKVKCDGKLPACTACEKAGRESECSAANDQFARGKERSYVAALELRIEKLQRRLQYAQSRKASVASHDPDTQSVSEADRRDSLASIRAAIHRKAAKSRENRDVNSIVSDFGSLSVDAVTRDFEPTEGNITFARLVLAATTNDDIPQPRKPDLPPRQNAQDLVQFFMANVYSLFPCFSETALWAVLDDVYQQDRRVVKDSDYWLMYMVLAIGATAQSQGFNDDYYRQGIDFVSKAISYADKALTPGYMTQIQSLILLTIYSLLDPAHFDSWHLIGFTTRAIVDLGLHQDPPPSSVSDKSSLDMRRKIFYCTYALDRVISMAQTRTFSFTDESVNVAFPTGGNARRKESLTGPMSGPQSADLALLLFQLRRAQSFWYQELYQSRAAPLANPSAFLWQMCLEMREWGESLPDAMPAGTRRMFEQELWYSYVYCIAPSSRAPEITDYTRTLIFEYSIAYLNSMYDTAHAGLTQAFYTYLDAWKVYFMANQFIAVLRDAEDLLLSGVQIPPPVALPGSAPAPPIPRRLIPPGTPADDNTTRSIWCLERIPQTLGVYGTRWMDAVGLKQHVEESVGKAIERLRKRQRMQRAAQQHPYPGMHQPMPPQMHGQMLGMRWAGVDPSQMTQGGPPR